MRADLRHARAVEHHHPQRQQGGDAKNQNGDGHFHICGRSAGRRAEVTRRPEKSLPRGRRRRRRSCRSGRRGFHRRSRCRHRGRSLCGDLQFLPDFDAVGLQAVRRAQRFDGCAELGGNLRQVIAGFHRVDLFACRASAFSGCRFRSPPAPLGAAARECESSARSSAWSVPCRDSHQ